MCDRVGRVSLLAGICMAFSVDTSGCGDSAVGSAGSLGESVHAVRGSRHGGGANNAGVVTTRAHHARRACLKGKMPTERPT